MRTKLEKAIAQEVQNESNSDFATKVCDEYLKYYFEQLESTKEKFKRLLEKYNDKTILSYLGENSFPEDYVHMCLGHSMGEKSLMPMLDNGGDIYPPDLEIGYLIMDPELGDINESEEEMMTRWKYHGLIFFAWLSIIWMEIEGYRSNIVVKTTENNSVTSFYLNDFQFDDNSSFDLEEDWKSAIRKHNLKSIEMQPLLENIKKEYDRR